MGAAIAAEYAAAGFEVRVTTSGDARPPHLLGALADAGATETALSRIDWRADTESACRGAEIVVESLPEDLELKRRELVRAQSAAPAAVLATNTSSLTVGKIARGLPDPSRLLATHYLNPPSAFRIVEIAASEDTAEEAVEHILEVLRGMGKTPIRLGRDSPGFVVNRLQFALLRESVALVDEGVATPADLDAIVSSGLGRRWAALGPFATVTLGGEKVFRQIAGNIFPVLSRADAPPDSLARLELGPADIERVRAERDRLLALLADVP